ncbi:MAG: SAM-dependent methyltransferase [Methylacidiphilales bacterium]|nr:SAM-dependent methyltransferase [Candidatus Methylacidiphilales bacterium]
MPENPEPLGECIRARIQKSGAIRFSSFMRLCLYEPELGYYASGTAALGRRGDFFTSVSTGPLFGRLLADGFATIWESMGRPSSWQLVEQGGHNGQLCRDILDTLTQRHPEAFSACTYILIEPLPGLRRKQEKAIEPYAADGKIVWHGGLDEIPDASLNGVFFSNELIDSFPVDCVCFRGKDWKERLVGWDGDLQRFVWVEAACNESLQSEIIRWKLPQIEGYVAEIHIEAAEWMRQVARTLGQGVVVIIDYGGLAEDLYKPERPQGTLRAYSKHRQFEDVLSLPGAQDLTSNVNFSLLKEEGEAQGLKTLRYSDQHHFLIELGRLGFLREIEKGMKQNPNEPGLGQQLRHFKTLMHTEMMGSLFKVLIQSKGEARLAEL